MSSRDSKSSCGKRPSRNSERPPNLAAQQSVPNELVFLSVRWPTISAEHSPKWTFDFDKWPAGITRLETIP